MSKISTALRAAALGPTPNRPAMVSSWVHWSLHERVAGLSDGQSYGGYLLGLSDEERRLFLLFAAEAVEAEE